MSIMPIKIIDLSKNNKCINLNHEFPQWEFERR